MAERADLLSTLPPDVRDNAEKLYDELARTQAGERGGTLGDGPDPRDIVGELHRRGLLDQGQLREAVLALEASLKVKNRGDEPPKDAAPQVLGRLGAGAMGEVLIAKDPGLNRIVAVKRLLPEGARRKPALRRFYKEAQITAQLDHPGIVPIHGLVETQDGGLAYAMKLVRGRTLEAYLEEAKAQHAHGKPDQAHALPARLERFLHVCDALAYAHDRGVLHRDLKPENIMVGAFGEVLVMDWGIAKLLQNAEAEESLGDDLPQAAQTSSKATRVGTVMGTPRYMSPEQAEGRTDILDPRSDQYALGLILFEIVSLSPAVKHTLDLDGALLWARTGRKQPLTHAHGEHVPRELAAIVEKATQLDRDDRYPDVAAMAEDIRRYLRDEEVLAKRDNLMQRFQRWVGRHRQLMLNLLFLATLGIVGTGAIGGVSVIGVAAFLQARAQEREARIAEVLGAVSDRARSTETELHRLEALLQGLAYAAAYASTVSGADLPWDPLREEPPGRHPGKRYDAPVSVTWPRITAVADHPSGDETRALAGLGPQLARVLVESSLHPPNKLDDRRRHEFVADEGVPVVWARVATVDGLLATLPATGALVTGALDFRKADWYNAPRGQRGVVWTGPVVDDRGQGLILTATLPIVDAGGRALGMASMDVTVDHLANLVRAGEGAQAWVVDAKGRVVVDGATKARELEAYEPVGFPRADVWEAASATANGQLDLGGGELAVWSRLPTLGFTYIVIGSADALVAAAEEEPRLDAIDRPKLPGMP